MTYCPPHDTVQTYEFTALTGADVLAEGDTNLGCGDCFTMPASAGACVTVTDNDGTLSGDAWNNEVGDDHSWQIADITVDGVLVHDDQGIYAEEVYVLHDEYGNCYWMVEIEVAGAAVTDRDDFFAFIGNVPPAGATLTVASRHNVTSNWIEFRDLSAGLKWDLDADGKVTIEAEDMALWGYKVDDVMAASGGEVIRLKSGMGQAAVTFGGEEGSYTIELAYIDENDGQGTIEVWLNDTLLRVIDLSVDNNGNGGDWSTISKITIEDVDLAAGDEIVLKGTRDAWEFARIDALTFCLDKNEPPEALDDLGETDEDTVYTQNLLDNDSDPDGDPLVVTSVNGQAAGTDVTVTSAGGRVATLVVSAAGVLVLDPVQAFNDLAFGETDTVSVEYEISDGNGGTATATATVVVNGLNDPPVANDDFYQVSESALTILDILENDIDPEDDALTKTILTQPIEGAVSIDAAGNVVFDPLDDFLTLSDGQTATVTFDYEISDGEFTDTATVTVQVLGEGVCIKETVTTTGVADLPGGDFTVLLDTPDITKDGSAEAQFSVLLGDLATETYNVIFIVDVSGSTDEPFVPGGTTTILEAEVAALQNLTDQFIGYGIPDGQLTITVLPFNSRANPTEPVGVLNEETGEIDIQSFPIETFGDNEVLDAADVDASLSALAAGGETNYIAAIFAAAGTAQVLDPLNQETNLFYFLSDGNPFPLTQNTEAQLQTFSGAFLHPRGDVHGIAIGSEIDPIYLDAVDNTGGAALVQDTAALEAATLESAVDPGVILAAELTVLNASGAVADTFQFTGADFSETPLGFELDAQGITGLDVLVGQTNTATLTVDFDEDGDLVADATLSLSVDIEGVLPVSFDF